MNCKKEQDFECSGEEMFGDLSGQCEDMGPMNCFRIDFHKAPNCHFIEPGYVKLCQNHSSMASDCELRQYYVSMSKDMWEAEQVIVD